MMHSNPLHALLARSADLHRALHAHLDGAAVNTSKRSRLTLAASEIGMEHGDSVCALIANGNLTSAIVLSRAQFEAVTRGVWLHFVATDHWVDECLAKAAMDPLKSPNMGPGMDELLKAITTKGPTSVGPSLAHLKDGIWVPMNSYVHTGLRPLLEHQAGRPPTYATNTILNANALTIMAAGVIAALSHDSDRVGGLGTIQLGHQDCLPPLDQPPQN